MTATNSSSPHTQDAKGHDEPNLLTAIAQVLRERLPTLPDAEVQGVLQTLRDELGGRTFYISRLAHLNQSGASAQSRASAPAYGTASESAPTASLAPEPSGACLHQAVCRHWQKMEPAMTPTTDVPVKHEDLKYFYEVYLEPSLRAFAMLLDTGGEPSTAQARDLERLATALAGQAGQAFGLAPANPAPPAQSSPAPPDAP